MGRRAQRMRDKCKEKHQGGGVGERIEWVKKKNKTVYCSLCAKAEIQLFSWDSFLKYINMYVCHRVVLAHWQNTK